MAIRSRVDHVESIPFSRRTKAHAKGVNFEDEKDVLASLVIKRKKPSAPTSTSATTSEQIGQSGCIN